MAVLLDQWSEVWEHVYAMKYIEDKWLTKQEVRDACSAGKHNNSAWVNAIKRALDAVVEGKKHPFSWQIEQKDLMLSWEGYWIMSAMRKEPSATPGQLAKAHPHSYKPGIRELEERGMVILRRNKNGSVTMITPTDTFPRRKEDVPTPEVA